MTIEHVDFHFDVMCPWAYQTSRWIREVRDLTGLEVRWKFFSLEEINRVEGKKHPWEREWSYGWSMLRIGALLRRRGPDAARRVVRAGRPGAARGGPQAAPPRGRRGAARRDRHRPRRRRRGARRPDHARRRARRARQGRRRRRVRRADAVLPRRPVPVRPGRRRSADRRGGARAVGARARLAAVPAAVRDPATEGGAPTWR